MNSFAKLLPTLILLTSAPAALAQIYKCDGPDGPIYSDEECELNAATVELRESTGLVGVSDEEKADLAEKKTARDQAQTRDNENAPVFAQNNNYKSQNNGRWVRGRDNLRNHPDTSAAFPYQRSQVRQAKR